VWHERRPSRQWAEQLVGNARPVRRHGGRHGYRDVEQWILERIEQRILERIEQRILERIEQRILERIEQWILERIEQRIGRRGVVYQSPRFGRLAVR
jgi:hypothetical protein